MDIYTATIRFVKVGSFDPRPRQAAGPGSAVALFDARLPFCLTGAVAFDQAQPFGLAVAQSIRQAQFAPFFNRQKKIAISPGAPNIMLHRGEACFTLDAYAKGCKVIVFVPEFGFRGTSQKEHPQNHCRIFAHCHSPGGEWPCRSAFSNRR